MAECKKSSKVMKSRIKKTGLQIIAAMVWMMAGFGGSPGYGQEPRALSTGYQFGGDANEASGVTVRLRVPARATILNVNTTIRRDPGRDLTLMETIPLRVEFKNPEGGNAAGTQFPSAGPVQIALPDFVNPLGTFRSQKGCDDTWKVNIKTQSGLKPKARISGTVTIIFLMPGPVNLDMIGGSPVLRPGEVATRDITGHDLLAPNQALIAGPGIFRIKAKWDNDLLHAFAGHQAMRVTLLKPNGNIANGESGRPSAINFTYRVTQADADLRGRWKVRVRNQGNNATEHFDIEQPLVFNSTFQAQCLGGASLIAS